MAKIAEYAKETMPELPLRMLKEATATQWGSKRLIKGHEKAIELNKRIIDHFERYQTTLSWGTHTPRGKSVKFYYDRSNKDTLTGSILIPAAYLTYLLHPTPTVANIAAIAEIAGFFFFI